MILQIRFVWISDRMTSASSMISCPFASGSGHSMILPHDSGSRKKSCSANSLKKARIFRQQDELRIRITPRLLLKNGVSRRGESDTRGKYHRRSLETLEILIQVCEFLRRGVLQKSRRHQRISLKLFRFNIGRLDAIRFVLCISQQQSVDRFVDN